MKRMYCCWELYKAIEADVFFSEWKEPVVNINSHTLIKTTIRDMGVYLMSDSGHGGILKIDYCPFCGSLIQYKV